MRNERENAQTEGDVGSVWLTEHNIEGSNNANLVIKISKFLNNLLIILLDNQALMTLADVSLGLENPYILHGK